MKKGGNPNYNLHYEKLSQEQAEATKVDIGFDEDGNRSPSKKGKGILSQDSLAVRNSLEYHHPIHCPRPHWQLAGGCHEIVLNAKF